MAAAVCVIARPQPVSGQRLASSSGHPTELEVGAMAVLASRDFGGPELGFAFRPGGQSRLVVRSGFGVEQGAAAFRAEAAAQFVLWPLAVSGVTPLVALGLAARGAEHTHGAGYLLASLGVEQAPGRSHGWYIDAGVGGGVRVAAGMHWRWFHHP